MTPMPPSRASAIAMRASVTVSMAAETIGISSAIVRVRRVVVDTSPGKTVGLGGNEQDVVEGETFLGELPLQGEETLDLVLTKLDAHRRAIVPSEAAA